MLCSPFAELVVTCLQHPTVPLWTTKRPKFPDDESTYYYRPSDHCAFVDYEVLNDRITTTEATTRHIDFRDDVIRRDGSACVITNVVASHCVAAHLIPHSKSDEYVRRVVQLRSPKDGSTSRIDITENGIFISKIVHSMLGKGEVAFIKVHQITGWDPEHIKRFRQGDERQVYITLQWIKPEDFNPKNFKSFQAVQNASVVPSPYLAHIALQNVDALFRDDDGDRLPSTLILDYIAAYKAWQSDGLSRMEAYINQIMHRFRHLPLSYQMSWMTMLLLDQTAPTTPIVNLPSHGNATLQQGGVAWKKPWTNSICFFMYIHGITPEVAAELRQKEIEREEWAAQEASRSKVMEWRNHLDVY